MMKQRLFLLLSMMLMTAAIEAAPVSMSQAKTKALQFINGKRAAARGMGGSAPTALEMAATANDAYYVFNVGRDEGFVIVSGDDRAPAVLGYSDSGTFSTEDMPANMAAWLQGYASEMAALNEGDATAESRSQEAPKSWRAVEPLLTTTWNQREPYNNLLDGSVTGCVATAMAQIMYYHRWPQDATTKIPAYSGHLLPLLPTTFDWGSMKNSYTSATGAGTDAVAKLMKYCGYSVETKYSSSSSTANAINVINAMTNYFGYDQNISYLNRDNYSIDEWETIIYEEIANGRPVLYGGSTVSGAGHEFVCDGYDGNGLFHFNWGWGGDYDGFFVIWSANPKGSGIGGSGTKMGYSVGQNAIVGIQKPTGEPARESEPELTAGEMKVYNNTLTYQRKSFNDDFTVYIYSTAINNTGTKITAMSGLGLYGEGVSKNIYSNNTWTTYGLGATNNFSNKYYGIPFGAGLTGTYRIVSTYRLQNSNTWYPDKRSENFYIEATMTETTMTLRVMPVEDLQVTKVEFLGNKMVGVSQDMKVSIKNNGSEYNGKLYLLMNNNNGYSAGEQVALRAGETTDVHFHYTPTASGTNTYRICKVGNSSFETLPGGSGSQSFVAYSATDNIDLDIAMDIKNVITDNNIFGNTFTATLTATNNSSNMYHGAEIGVQYEYSSGGYKYTQWVYMPQPKLQPSETVSTNLSFAMDYGTTYTITAYQVKNGIRTAKGTTYKVKASEGIKITRADGTTEAMAVTSALTVPAGALAVDMRGVSSVNSINTAAAGKNCLYIVDEDANISGLGTTNVVRGTTASEIVLYDGADFASPITFTAQQSSYERTFDQGTDGTGCGWTTLVLPFDVERVIVDDRELDWFHSASDRTKDFWLRELVSDGDGSVTFGYVNELKANTPYIIAVPGSKWGAAWNLVGKTLKFIGKSQTVIKKSTSAETSGDHYNFVGTTIRQQLNNVYTLNTSGNTFMRGNATVEAFRAYFTAIIGSRAVQLDIFDILDNIGDMTAISSPTTEPQTTGDIYTLDGRKVESTLDALTKGIYVVNGKKIVKN